MKTKSSIPYFGSEASVAEELASLINDREHVMVPFVGGAAIIQYLHASHIVANDTNHHLINFFRQVTDRGEALAGLCERTLSHPDEITRARRDLNSPDAIIRAWAYWALCWLGRKGRAGTGKELVATNTSVRYTRSGGSNASRLLAASGDIEAWSEHFRRCEFCCEDFRVFLAKAHDRIDSAIYCDPPWRGAPYAQAFDDQDHRDLEAILRKFSQSKVLVRYGADEFIEKLYWDWNRITKTSRSQSNSSVEELWFMNWERDEKTTDVPA